MVYKQVPKGYLKAEHPLPHNFNYDLNFSIDDSLSLNATYLPLILNDEGLVNADTKVVNPRHGSFAEENTPYCFHDSIIPRMTISMSAKLTKAGIETDALRSVKFNWMPVYVSFLNRLEAQDSKTAVQVEDILELQHETVGKSVYPIWTGTNMNIGTVGIHGSATTAFMGLTVNNTIETVAFDKELFFDAMQYYTNSPMLKKVIGKMHSVHVSRDRVYKYYSNNFINPMVKRINDYTFCGILVHVPKINDAEQLGVAADTTGIDHMMLQCYVRYDEWNSEFDQTTS